MTLIRDGPETWALPFSIMNNFYRLIELLYGILMVIAGYTIGMFIVFEALDILVLLEICSLGKVSLVLTAGLILSFFLCSFFVHEGFRVLFA